MGKRVLKGILILLLGFVIRVGPLATAEVREPRSGVEGLVDAQGCRGCHQIQGRGGTFGPSLEGVGQRLDRDQLRRKLTDPAAAAGESRMPAFNHLEPEDLAILVDFLATL